jgi:hypothetical protein
MIFSSERPKARSSQLNADEELYYTPKNNNYYQNYYF